MTYRNLTLYHAASSYYSMIARYGLALSGIEYHSQLLDIHKKREQLQAWYVTINPAMTVPALKCDNQVFDSSTAIVRFAVATKPEPWFESGASAQQIDQIATWVDAHDAFEVERLTFNVLLLKFPPLRFVFPRLLRKVCIQLSEQIERGGPHASALEAKLVLNQSRLDYFTGASIDERQRQEVLKAQRFLQLFGQAPAGQWLMGSKPSHADVVLLVFLARLRMVGLLERVQVPGAFIDWLEQKTQTPAFKAADIWVKLQPLRLMTHR